VEDVEHSECLGPERSFVDSCFKEPGAISEELKEKNPEYRTKGYCPHSFKVCSKCGKAVGYGGHGKLTVVPDGCKAQVASMQSKRSKHNRRKGD
jgi:hypothetical protein